MNDVFGISPLNWFFIIAAIISAAVGIYSAYLTRKQNKRKAVLMEASNGDVKILKLLMSVAFTIFIVSLAGFVSGPIDIISPLGSSQVKIINLHDGQTVANRITVRGTIDGTIPNGSYLWLLVGYQSENMWWPQGGSSITPINGVWSEDALVGGGPDLDIGKEQQIIVILVDERVNNDLTGWVKRGRVANEWPGMRLPAGEVLDEISVIKGKG